MCVRIKYQRVILAPDVCTMYANVYIWHIIWDLRQSKAPSGAKGNR